MSDNKHSAYRKYSLLPGFLEFYCFTTLIHIEILFEDITKGVFKLSTDITEKRKDCTRIQHH